MVLGVPILKHFRVNYLGFPLLSTISCIFSSSDNRISNHALLTSGFTYNKEIVSFLQKEVMRIK